MVKVLATCCLIIKSIVFALSGGFDHLLIYCETLLRPITIGALKTKREKQVSKPKKTVANEEEVVVETDDEETNDEVQEPVQTSQYEHEVNEDDVDQIIYDHPSVLP